jgi:hypothetical protein
MKPAFVRFRFVSPKDVRARPATWRFSRKASCSSSRFRFTASVRKRHSPGLHVEPARANDFLEGIFLARVDRAYYRWHPQKPFFVLSFAVPESKEFASRKIAGRLYCTQKSLWKLNWFLRDFGYEPDLLGRDEVDEKALLGLTGILRTTRKSFTGRTSSTLKHLHHPANGNSSPRMRAKVS